MELSVDASRPGSAGGWWGSDDDVLSRCGNELLLTLAHTQAYALHTRAGVRPSGRGTHDPARE